MNVQYIGPWKMPGGYGTACRDYLVALHAADVHVRIVPTRGTMKVLPSRYRFLNGFVGPGKRRTTHSIVHALPSAAPILARECPPNVKKICVTTWESSLFPAEYVAPLDAAFDLILVCSDFCRNSMVTAGLPAEKVVVLPYAFDMRLLERHTVVRASTDPYRFYTVLTWMERKNPMGLLTAYLTEFTNRDNVLLTIVTPQVNELEVADRVRSLGLHDLPAVEFHSDLDDDAYWAVHATSDCYVTASRAEGFGLGACEATLFGNRVIASPLEGMEDFFPSEPQGLQVRAYETPAIVPEALAAQPVEIAPGVRLTPTLFNGQVGINGTQTWLEPCLADLQRDMRQVYEERNTYSRRVEPEVVHLKKRYSYQAIGKRFRDLLASIPSPEIL